MNKYTKWYNQIIDRAKSRVLKPPFERHHIKPRSLGGTDNIENIAFITPREHFICHWLLTKMTTGEDQYKMLNALRMMRAENPGQKRYSTKITARVYENLKKKYAQLQSERVRGKNNPMWGRTHTEEARQAIREKNTGKKLTEDQIARQVAAQTGRKRAPFSEEWRAKMSESKQGEKNNRYGVKLSDETRRKISEKATGRKQSEETIKKKADAIRGVPKPKKLCPHCEQMIAVNTYSRWHGDRCPAQRQ